MSLHIHKILFFSFCFLLNIIYIPQSFAEMEIIKNDLEHQKDNNIRLRQQKIINDKKIEDLRLKTIQALEDLNQYNHDNLNIINYDKNKNIKKDDTEYNKALHDLEDYINSAPEYAFGSDIEAANFYFDNKYYDKAISLYEILAEQNNNVAQNKLGNIYHDGLGVDKDFNKSFLYYSQSAKNGNKYAQFNLGNSYYHGEGCVKNITEALKWLKLSCSAGYKPACESQSYIVSISKKIDNNNKSHLDNNVKMANQLYLQCSYKNDTSLGVIVETASDIIGFFSNSMKGVAAELAGAFLSNTEEHIFTCNFAPSVSKYSIAYFFSNEKERFRKKETKELTQNDLNKGVKFSTTTTKSNLDYITIRADHNENGEIEKDLYVYEIDSTNNRLIPVDINDFLNNTVNLYKE